MQILLSKHSGMCFLIASLIGRKISPRKMSAANGRRNSAIILPCMHQVYRS